MPPVLSEKIRPLILLGAAVPFCVGLYRYLTVVGNPGVLFHEHIAYTNLTAIGAMGLLLQLVPWTPLSRVAIATGIILWSAGNDLYIMVRLAAQAQSTEWVAPFPLLPITFLSWGMVLATKKLEGSGQPRARWVRWGLYAVLSLLALVCALTLWRGTTEQSFYRSELSSVARRCPVTPERLCCPDVACQRPEVCPTLTTECYGQSAASSCFHITWQTPTSSKPPPCAQCLQPAHLQRTSLRCD